MSLKFHKMPTLGYFNKIMCDCLGLWVSESKDVTFNVPASEKDRRAALRSAFESIKKQDGTYGSLYELVSVTSLTAPKMRAEVKKSKTIQSYVSHLSKDDFESHSEFMELKEYIETLIHEKFSKWGVSELAVKFYSSSMMYYREYVRELSSSPENQSHAYQYFLSCTLIDLAKSLADEESTSQVWPCTDEDETRWPLRTFIDSVSNVCEVSLHKLHQLHEARINSNLPNNELWAYGYKAQPVNTKSKQVIERMSKNNKIKWDTVYPIIQPLACLMPNGLNEDIFAAKAFSAFISHNIYIQASELGLLELVKRERYPDKMTLSAELPVSDRIDYLLNDDTGTNETTVQSTFAIYQKYLQTIRPPKPSTTGQISIPSTFDILYNRQHRYFTSINWHKNLTHCPSWITEWALARDAIVSADEAMALQHFKNALKKAKYVAGPLFVPLYIQICAFCKAQYKIMSNRNEVDLFERFYEPLGSEASSYSKLAGYIPESIRDPNTLLPRSSLPLKDMIFISEIDLLMSVFSDLLLSKTSTSAS